MKSKARWRIYLHLSGHWELSGNTGLRGKVFSSKALAEQAAKNFGSDNAVYKAATKRPKTFYVSNGPTIIS